MKRKQKGGKKSKAKKPKIVKDNEAMDDVALSNPEGSPVVDLSDNDEAESGAEAESPSSVAGDIPERSPVAANEQKNSPMVADVPKSSPVAADVPENSPIAPDVSESPPVEAVVPESSPMAADEQKSSPMAADVPKSSPVAADVPKSSPVAADVPQSSPMEADLPESSPVEADVPESSPVAADVPESSPVAADLPQSSSVLTEKCKPVIPTRPTDGTANKVVYTRVKVKIKSSKALDTQHTSSVTVTQSDTDKSCQQVEAENQGAACKKIEDSGNSLPESNSDISGTASKNLGSIKTMSVDFGSSSMSPCSNVETTKGDTKEKDPELPIRTRQSDKQQLDASLEVIKKVMKLDAAEPFNAPVDPIALNIPDYFDVIKNPMDFGTICNNIESGTKYLNSEDVYKDVQYIWDNCTKYNNKGAYILELMKRVKKNFLKYWVAAGLYCDHASGNNSSETVKDVTPASDGVISTKNAPPTPTPTPTPTPVPSTTKKLHGLKRHKDGCMCAICVMMRKRQERLEADRLLNPEFEMSEEYMDEEDDKHQGDSSMGSPTEYTSKNMENGYDKQYESMDDGGKFSELRQLYHRSRDGNGAEWDQNKGTLDKTRKTAMYERLSYMDRNPVLFDLCGSLFDDKQASVWNGPHSLIKDEVLTRKSSLLSTISSFMK